MRRVDAAAEWTLALSAVSALAASGAVGYASAALAQARAASRDAHRWRQEDFKDRRRERDDSARANTAVELRLARIRALENLIDALVALIRQVQEEEPGTAAPADQYSPGRRAVIPLSRTKAAITIYQALDCPDVDAVNHLAEAVGAADDDRTVWLNAAVAAVDALLTLSQQRAFV
jgi:hypothetical protein